MRQERPTCLPSSVWHTVGRRLVYFTLLRNLETWSSPFHYRLPPFIEEAKNFADTPASDSGHERAFPIANESSFEPATSFRIDQVSSWMAFFFFFFERQILRKGENRGCTADDYRWTKRKADKHVEWRVFAKMYELFSCINEDFQGPMSTCWPVQESLRGLEMWSLRAAGYA